MFRIRAAPVADFVVCYEGAPAAQLLWSHRPDSAPGSLEHTGHLSHVSPDYCVQPRLDLFVSNSSRQIIDRSYTRTQQIVVVAFFVARIFGVDNGKRGISAVWNLRAKVLLVKALPERTDSAVPACLVGVVGPYLVSRDIERL